LKKFWDIFDVEVEKISGSELVKELNEKLEIKIVRIYGRKILIIDEIKKIKMNIMQISEYCIYYVN
jgi:hypothetical protein